MEKNLKNKILKKKHVRISSKDYQDNFEVEKLYLSVVIVTKYQGDHYVKEFIKHGFSSSFVVFGRGTAPSEIVYTLGLPETKKDIVLTVFKESERENINKLIDERFKFSKSSKGVSFNIPLDSVIGVLSYRFMSDTRINRRK